MKKSLLFLITLLSGFVSTSMFGMMTIVTKISHPAIRTTNRSNQRTFSSSPHPEKDYKYLSAMKEGSRLKEEGENCRPALIFKGKKEKALDSLEEELKEVAETGGKTVPTWLPETFAWGAQLLGAAAGTEMRKNAIRTILPNDPDKVKWEELRMYENLAYEFRNQWLERKKLEPLLKKQQEEEAKKNPKF